jgi:hypothetical protein
VFSVGYRVFLSVFVVELYISCGEKSNSLKLFSYFGGLKKTIIFTTGCQINYEIHNYRLTSVGRPRERAAREEHEVERIKKKKKKKKKRERNTEKIRPN